MTRVSDKTRHALEVQAKAAPEPMATVCTDASGARIRTVGIHLTGFAPGCEGLAIDNRRRWAVAYGISPLAAVRGTLKRINRHPRAVTPEEGEIGDINLLARPTVAQLGKADADLVPFATFYDGLTLEEVQGALAELIRAGWEPPAAVLSNID